MGTPQREGENARRIGCAVVVFSGQCARDAGHELLFVERFQDGRVRAKGRRQFYAVGTIHVLPSSGNRQDADRMLLCLERVEQVESVAIGHQDIEDHEIEGIRTDHLDCFASGGNAYDAVAAGFEPAPDDGLDFDDIIRDQDRLGGGGWRIHERRGNARRCRRCDIGTAGVRGVH